jgi:hypothetical protein
MYYYEVPEAPVNVRRAKCRVKVMTDKWSESDSFVVLDSNPSDQVEIDGWEDETFE